jgi:Arc/MetJ family transcription regulator
VCVATNLALDDELICEAQRLGRFKTKKDAVNAALEEFVRRRRVEELLSFFGSIDFDADYDYKEVRQRDAERIVTWDG